MIELYLKKIGNIMVPEYHSQDDFAALPNGTVFKVVLSQPRNYKFLKKFFSLIKCAYDIWEPNGTEGVTKCFETFREELIVLCGFYETVFSVHGNFKLVAKSISFAKMQEATFERLFSTAIDMIMKHVLKDHTRADFMQRLNRILGYS
jgi:hypothetical protein